MRNADPGHDARGANRTRPLPDFDGVRAAVGEKFNTRRARERPLRDAIAQLEARIAKLEAAQKAAEASLADPALYQDFARARPHVEALSAARAELAERYADWESKQLELEALANHD